METTTSPRPLRDELAALYQLSTRTIDRLIGKGMPCGSLRESMVWMRQKYERRRFRVPRRLAKAVEKAREGILPEVAELFDGPMEETTRLLLTACYHMRDSEGEFWISEGEAEAILQTSISDARMVLNYCMEEGILTYLYGHPGKVLVRWGGLEGHNRHRKLHPERYL